MDSTSEHGQVLAGGYWTMFPHFSSTTVSSPPTTDASLLKKCRRGHFLSVNVSSALIISVFHPNPLHLDQVIFLLTSAMPGENQTPRTVSTEQVYHPMASVGLDAARLIQQGQVSNCLSENAALIALLAAADSESLTGPAPPCPVTTRLSQPTPPCYPSSLFQSLTLLTVVLKLPRTGTE